MSIPDNGRRRPVIIAGVALVTALIVGVVIAVVSVRGADQRASLSSDNSQIVTRTTVVSTTSAPTSDPVTATTVSATSATPVATKSTTVPVVPRTTAKRPQPTAVAQAPVSGNASDFETSVLSLVNKQRAANGCADVKWNDELAVAARKHSQDMAVRNYFDHNTPDGVDPWQRIKAEGYMTPSGENIAAGQSTPESVMTSWMNSPGHRANILNCSSHALGVGMAKGGSYGIYWTQDFGTD